MKYWVVKGRVGIFLSYVNSDSFKITLFRSEIRIWFRIRNKLKIDWVSVVLTEFPPFYKSNLIFDFEFLFFSRWNLTTMFWQKIQIFYEHTYIYQIYIKIHAMSVCLSVLYFNSLPMNQFESQIYLWNSLNMVDILRLFKSYKNWNKKQVFFFFKFPPLPLPKGERSPPEGGDSRVYLSSK